MIYHIVIKQINNDRGLSEWLRGIGWGITWCHPINRSPAGLCSGVCSPAPNECFWVQLCVLPWKQINLGFRRQILKTVSIKQHKVIDLEHKASVRWYLPFGAVVALLTIKSVLSQCLLRVSHSLLLSSEILTSYLPWNSDGAFSCAILTSVFEITTANSVCEKFCLSIKFTQYQNNNILQDNMFLFYFKSHS